MVNFAKCRRSHYLTIEISSLGFKLFTNFLYIHNKNMWWSRYVTCYYYAFFVLSINTDRTQNISRSFVYPVKIKIDVTIRIILPCYYYNYTKILKKGYIQISVFQLFNFFKQCKYFCRSMQYLFSFRLRLFLWIALFFNSYIFFLYPGLGSLILWNFSNLYQLRIFNFKQEYNL